MGRGVGPLQKEGRERREEGKGEIRSGEGAQGEGEREGGWEEEEGEAQSEGDEGRGEEGSRPRRRAIEEREEGGSEGLRSPGRCLKSTE